jgi:hypothetical protein
VPCEATFGELGIRRSVDVMVSPAGDGCADLGGSHGDGNDVVMSRHSVAIIEARIGRSVAVCAVPDRELAVELTCFRGPDSGVTPGRGGDLSRALRAGGTRRRSS